MARRVMAVVGGLAVAATLAACGGTGTDAAQPSRTVPPGSVPGATTTVPFTCTPADAPLTVDAGKPTIEVPTDAAPTELMTEDLVVGDGPTADAGDELQLQYVGVLYKDGTEFDASWNRDAEPIPVTLGAGGVIPGWDQGIEGMKLGGRRELIIPPDLAYGEQGSGEKIGPNETLIFVVDLVQVCEPPSGATSSVPSSTPSTEATADSSTTSVVPSSSTTIGTESSTTTAG